ncbi:MAG: MerR family transcriptional regulator [Fimbriimonadales bacterium]
MSRLSLTDWYRYLESQFADDEPEPQPAEQPSQESAQASPSPHQPPAITPEFAPHANARLPAITDDSPTPHLPLQIPKDALVAIQVPDFAAFVPAIEQEVHRSMPAAPPQEVPESPPPTPTAPTGAPRVAETPQEPLSDGPRLRKRKGRKKATPEPEAVVPPEVDELWAKLPQYLRYLVEWTDDGITRKYYPVRGRDETREELIARLTDPVLTLEEAARLLGVCPATVRRYTDRGWLHCFRTEGNQRRFRLSDIVAFLEAQAARQPRGNRNAQRESETP